MVLSLLHRHCTNSACPHAFPQNHFHSSAVWGYLSGMASLVYLAMRSNPKLIDELTLAGHRVREALAVAEVLYLCENEPVDAIVIGADTEDPDVVVAQMRRITLRLKPGATTKDVIWELSLLFPKDESLVQ